MTFQSAQPTYTPKETLPSYLAKDLTESGTQAQIVLDGQTYVLRITRAGKLILTK